jgi:hypothetical protein
MIDFARSGSGAWEQARNNFPISEQAPGWLGRSLRRPGVCAPATKPCDSWQTQFDVGSQNGLRTGADRLARSSRASIIVGSSPIRSLRKRSLRAESRAMREMDHVKGGPAPGRRRLRPSHPRSTHARHLTNPEVIRGLFLGCQMKEHRASYGDSRESETPRAPALWRSRPAALPSQRLPSCDRPQNSIDWRT